MPQLPDDLLGPAARDPRISEIFYFFEALTTITSGRTVGRKIGVIQEVILKKYLARIHRSGGWVT